MPSQFFGLNIAYTGLQAANANLNTTANNASNANTEGYTRQKVTQVAADALRTNTSYGMAGAGVSAISVDQIRDEYYDLKYWNSKASLGDYEAKETYMKQIENYFTETEVTRGFTTIFSEMFDGFNEVFKSPGDGTVKTEALSLATSLCTYFQEMSSNLTKLQEDVNSEIKALTDEINSIASEIATLNKQINIIEVNGNPANELRDKRNLLIDQLSEIVDVEVDEIPVYTTEGGDELSGATRYLVNIAGGQNLVNTYEYSTLSCVSREFKANQSDAEGLYEIEWSNGLEFNLYGKNLNGKLKGLIELRDGNNGEYFHGISDKTAVNNGDGTYDITINVNNSYLKDMNKCTLSPNGEIKLGGKIYEYNAWNYDKASGTYTFTIKSDTDPSTYLGKSSSVGNKIEYQGIPYYQEQMNEWVRQFAEAMNKIQVKAKDENGDSSEVLFGARMATEDPRDIFYDFDEEASVIYSDGDNYYQLTAKNFMVNVHMMEDVSKFYTSSDYYSGQDNQDVIEQLLDVKSNKDKMTFRGCSAEEFLQCITADTALNTSSAITFTKNYTDITDAILTQRTSVSGVDNDEEALNLIKFQEAYNLAAKMMQVMTEIYDRLILQTGV